MVPVVTVFAWDIVRGKIGGKKPGSVKLRVKVLSYAIVGTSMNLSAISNDRSVIIVDHG